MCPDCKHEEHEPGKCPKDNCGEGEISHSSAIWSDRGRVIIETDAAHGHTIDRVYTRLRPRKRERN